MPDRLVGIDEKIKRAKKHVSDLELEIEGFRDRQTYSMFTEEQSEAGKKLYRVKITEHPPGSWATIIGDAVHNLRSALDHLAWQLVEAGGGTPGDRTQFPIARSADAVESELEGRIKGASPAAIEAIRRLKPYNGGNDLLWRLHRLDIYDKHRLLLAVGAAYRHFGLKVKLDVPWKPGEPVEFPTINIAPADRKFPLEDGAVLMVAPLDDKTEFEFAFEVAFADGEVVQGESVLDTLHQLVDFVEATIDALKSFLV